MNSSDLQEINPSEYFKSYARLPAEEKAKFIGRFFDYINSKPIGELDLAIAENGLTGCALRIASFVNKEFTKGLRDVQIRLNAISKAPLVNVFEESAIVEYRCGFRSEPPQMRNRNNDVVNNDENEPTKTKHTRNKKTLKQAKFKSFCIPENISKCNIKVVEEEEDWDNFKQVSSKFSISPYVEDVILINCKLFEPNGEAYGYRNDFGVCGYICEKVFFPKFKPCLKCTHDIPSTQENDTIVAREELINYSLHEWARENRKSENRHENDINDKRESNPNADPENTAADFIIESAFTKEADTNEDNNQNSNIDDHWDGGDDRNNDDEHEASSEEDNVIEFKCNQIRRYKENVESVNSHIIEQWELANAKDDEKDCPIKVGRVVNIPQSLNGEGILERYEQSKLVLDDLKESAVRWKGGMFLDPVFMDVNYEKRKEREMNAFKNKISLKGVDQDFEEDENERSFDVDMASEDEGGAAEDRGSDLEEDVPLNLDINFEDFVPCANREEQDEDPAFVYDKLLEEEKTWKVQALDDIDKKVALCHKQLKILIEEDESKPSLEVHDCAKRILNSFPGDGPTFKFTSLPITNKEELTFYFFTCLQLINSGNLEILNHDNCVSEEGGEFRIINRILIRDNIENAQI